MRNLHIDGTGDNDNDRNDEGNRKEKKKFIHSYSVWLDVSMSVKRAKYGPRENAVYIGSVCVSGKQNITVFH